MSINGNDILHEHLLKKGKTKSKVTRAQEREFIYLSNYLYICLLFSCVFFLTSLCLVLCRCDCEPNGNGMLV